ncbi:kelch repeat and BTB domain-containing protein 2-like [Branchiostoma lanceolatum]|uniref:kelch repeat and BTB domain-containing protein 2-like n=1 Tax=Branchiostoma lanceolatum TaxID=7740 RepID=UPI00345436AA
MASTDQEPHASAVRPRSYQDESYLHGFLGTVGDLQKAGVLQDVILEVEGRRFPCHRLVLSAASPYFRAMFTSDMAESRQKAVVLQGLDAGMIGEILSYIYSGNLHVSPDKVQPLYQAADLLQLDYVRDTCSSYMAKNVERSTCVDLYKFVDVFSVDTVRKVCLQHIAKYFTEVASSEEFYSLSVNQLTEIISHDELDVKEETTVWEAVVRWVQHSREDRLHHLPSILLHIRSNFLTSDDTAAILEHPLVMENPGSSEVIRNAVQKGNSDPKPRLGMTMEMALLINTCTDLTTDDLLFMNPREGKNISCKYSPEKLRPVIAMTVTSDNNMYLMTEDSESNDQLSMLKYNHAGNEWEHAGMSSVSRLLGPDDYWSCDTKNLVEVDQVLYYLSMGGRRGSESQLVYLTKYDRDTDQWQQCSQLQIDECETYCAALSCGSHIYYLTTFEVHRYDPSQDRWCSRSPLTNIMDVCTAVAMGTEIFCTDVEFSQTIVYSTESDSWQELQGSPIPGNLDVHADDVPRLFVLANQLHILFKVYNYVEEEFSVDTQILVYDRSADAWGDLKCTLPGDTFVPRGSMCSVAHMYLPYLGA